MSDSVRPHRWQPTRLPLGESLGFSSKEQIILLILDFVLGTILVSKDDPQSPSSLEWLLSWGFAIWPIKTFINLTYD